MNKRQLFLAVFLALLVFSTGTATAILPHSSQQITAEGTIRQQDENPNLQDRIAFLSVSAMNPAVGQSIGGRELPTIHIFTPFLYKKELLSLLFHPFYFHLYLHEHIFRLLFPFHSFW